MIEKLLSLLGIRPDTKLANIVIQNDDQHNVVHQQGVNLISPYMRLLGRDPRINGRSRAKIRRGIAMLDSVTAYAPTNWAAYWTKGKGYQSLREHAAAKREFGAALAIQKGNPDVAREYAAVCLETGDGLEALEATQHAITIAPNDAGLYANAALALLILGRYDEASAFVDNALAMDGDDKISRAVKKVVCRVMSGKRPQPRNMADLLRYR